MLLCAQPILGGMASPSFPLQFATDLACTAQRGAFDMACTHCTYHGCWGQANMCFMSLVFDAPLFVVVIGGGGVLIRLFLGKPSNSPRH